MRSSLRLMSNLLMIIVLFLILYAYAMFQGGFVSWFLFFSFFPIILFQIGLLFYPMNRWKVSRDLTYHSIQAGDSIVITIQIERFIPFPLFYCMIEDMLPHSLQKIDSHYKKYTYLNTPEKLITQRNVKEMIFPWFRRKIKLSYTLDRIPRGEHKFASIKIQTGDFFGFVKKEHHYTVRDILVAVPKQRDMLINDQFKRLDQDHITKHAWNTQKTNVSTGVREYIPGDKYSWIDWKQTARQNTMMTREFEREKNIDTLLVLDRCDDQHLNQLAFEGAVEVIYSMMMEIVKKSQQVNLLTIGSRAEHFSLLGNPATVEHVRQYLARIQPEGTKTFSVQLYDELVKLNRAFNVILVVTNIEESFIQIIQQLKSQFTANRITVIMIQSQQRIRSRERHIIEQLQLKGVHVDIFSERELTQQKLEVNL